MHVILCLSACIYLIYDQCCCVMFGLLTVIASIAHIVYVLVRAYTLDEADL